MRKKELPRRLWHAGWRARSAGGARAHLLHLEHVHLHAIAHHDVAGLLPRFAGPDVFGLDGHVTLTARRHTRHLRAALAGGVDLHRIGAVETPGDDAMGRHGGRADLADRVEGHGAAGIPEVLLRAGSPPGAAAAVLRLHRLVGTRVDALAHGHRGRRAAFEHHLHFPKPRLARGQV